MDAPKITFKNWTFVYLSSYIFWNAILFLFEFIGAAPTALHPGCIDDDVIGSDS